MKVLHLIHCWFPLLILVCPMAQSLQLFFVDTYFPGELQHGFKLCADNFQMYVSIMDLSPEFLTHIQLPT